MKRMFLQTIIVVLLLCSCSSADIALTIPVAKTAMSILSTTPSPTPSPTPTPTPTPTPEPTAIPEREGLEDLKTQISDYISSLNGDWGVYVKNLNTNEFLTINEHEMYSASLIKLFIMAETYHAIEDGRLPQSDEVNNLLNKMITVSDNNSSNKLCEMLGNGDILVGFDIENENTRALDCTYTIQNTDLQNNRANSTIVYRGRNYTSPRDCGHILELIYKKELVSKAYSEEMLNLLKSQERTHKIPYPLPDDVETANKTGEMTGTENDAAIIFSPACDYILCIMSNNVNSNDKAISSIQTISQTVYSYFNPAQ